MVLEGRARLRAEIRGCCLALTNLFDALRGCWKGLKVCGDRGSSSRGSRGDTRELNPELLTGTLPGYDATTGTAISQTKLDPRTGAVAPV